MIFVIVLFLLVLIIIFFALVLFVFFVLFVFVILFGIFFFLLFLFDFGLFWLLLGFWLRSFLVVLILVGAVIDMAVFILRIGFNAVLFHFFHNVFYLG